LAVVAGAQDAPPDRTGIFYKPADRKWIALEELHRSGSGAQRVATFPGSSASVRITDPKPLFYIRSIPFASARDCRIVRLDRKNGHRELPARSGSNMRTSPSPAGHSIGFQTVQRNNGDYLLLPREALTPGEYMITFGAVPIPGYDFGVDKPRLDSDPRVAESRPPGSSPQF
jgi:hypothetical protein